jgi:hypothetical protein
VRERGEQVQLAVASARAQPQRYGQAEVGRRRDPRALGQERLELGDQLLEARTTREADGCGQQRGRGALGERPEARLPETRLPARSEMTAG